MKKLTEYLNEAINKRVNVDEMTDEQLKRFAKELTSHINNKYKLDKQIDLNYVIDSLKVLKGHHLMIMLSEFEYGELPEIGYNESTLFLPVYNMIYYYNQDSNEWQIEKSK